VQPPRVGRPEAQRLLTGRVRREVGVGILQLDRGGLAGQVAQRGDDGGGGDQVGAGGVVLVVQVPVPVEVGGLQLGVAVVQGCREGHRLPVRGDAAVQLVVKI